MPSSSGPGASQVISCYSIQLRTLTFLTCKVASAYVEEGVGDPGRGNIRGLVRCTHLVKVMVECCTGDRVSVALQRLEELNVLRVIEFRDCSAPPPAATPAAASCTGAPCLTSVVSRLKASQCSCSCGLTLSLALIPSISPSSRFPAEMRGLALNGENERCSVGALKK